MATAAQLQRAYDHALEDHIRKLVNVLMSSPANDHGRWSRFEAGMRHAISTHRHISADIAELIKADA